MEHPNAIIEPRLNMTNMQNIGWKDNNDGQGEVYRWATTEGEGVKIEKPESMPPTKDREEHSHDQRRTENCNS